MTELGNSIIRASAGSGKTYALVRRMVRLLALDVKPESIVALTFTRKAAGEFFARLLQTLAGFADHPENAAGYLDELSKDMRATCLRLLRQVIENMDRLRLGTLDSFFAAMVQSLPFELGLSGSGAIMSSHEASQARGEALDTVLVELMRPENEAARRELVESWKLATLGSEGNAPARLFEQWIENLHDRYLDCPDERRWGPARALWPDASSAIWSAGEDFAAAKAHLQSVLDLSKFTHKSAPPKWAAFFEELASFIPGAPLGDEVKYMLKPDRGSVPLLREGRGEWLMYSKKAVPLSMEESRALYRLLQIIVGAELSVTCQRTQGRCRLLSIYENAHRRLVRGAGRLTFDDLALLLSGKLDPGNAADWQERWEALKLDLEFRLNARYDHWLFDEFQDTSLRQWRVFANLIEEVLQDPERRRSFFAVGDLKQSIYLWREAEPELFLRVEQRHASQLQSESLRVSWRSSPDVLGLVNDLFGNTTALTAALPGAMEWWAFEPHESSSKTQTLRGHAALLTVATREEKDGALVALLRTLQPRERSLSCAVLTRGNDEAMRLAALLRQELHCDVVCESEEAVATDNAATLLFLSIMQLAAHPQDRQAWHHLQMTPLRIWLDENHMKASRLGAEACRELSRSGFLGTAQLWAGRLRAVFPELDAFAEWRLRQFLELCASFDESGSRDVDAFLRFAREHRVAAAGASSALQVMTIHKSKGLEFDIVILPEMQATSLDDARRESLLTERSLDGEIAWVLDRPPTAVLEWDGRLVEDMTRLKARAAFEGLCRLYVGMTRARYGLYLLQDSEKKKPDRSEAGLVRNILGVLGEEKEYPLATGPRITSLYERGTRDWVLDHKLKPALSPSAPSLSSAPMEPLGDLLRAAHKPVPRRTPSGEESFQLSGHDLLSPQRESSRSMGTLVHELFAAITWLESSTGSLEERWRALALDQRLGFADAAQRVKQSLDDPAVRAFFLNPHGRREVWIERRFDVLLREEWISGTFDRVILERDAKGRPTHATILDFKTDNVSSRDAAQKCAAGYKPQLQLYELTMPRLTGLTPDQITTALIFVAGPWVVQL